MTEKLSDENKSIMHSRLHKLQQLTIDEICLFGSKVLAVINDCCAMLKHQDPANQDFVQISILEAGAPYSLPSVNLYPYLKEAGTSETNLIYHH